MNVFKNENRNVNSAAVSFLAGGGGAEESSESIRPITTRTAIAAQRQADSPKHVKFVLGRLACC